MASKGIMFRGFCEYLSIGLKGETGAHSMMISLASLLFFLEQSAYMHKIPSFYNMPN
jgi:hypothetical protein